MPTQKRKYNSSYEGDYLNHVAFPMGGIGAGMICLEGTGTLSHVSLRHHPDIFHEPMIFSALHVKGAPVARVIEGPVSARKIFGPDGTGNGGGGKTYGLPRFRKTSFLARFPFGIVSLRDHDMPVQVEITGWSPFTPGDADKSSLPLCGLEFDFTNTSNQAIEAVYSFHADNFMRTNENSGAFIKQMDSGFILQQPALEHEPWQEGAFAAIVPDNEVSVDCAWFRGGWFDTLTMLWKTISEGQTRSRSPHSNGNPGSGASLYIPFRLQGHEHKTLRLLLAWYVPQSNLRVSPETSECSCKDSPEDSQSCYEPWYAGRFASIEEIVVFWRENYHNLRELSSTFRDCFYDTTFPPEVVEAAAANLTILKSPTCLRQKDGRFWGWEGCCDGEGCCPGSCTHVWNYAQALCHLFPDLERSMRHTEFHESQDARGHQNFRSALPIQPTGHDFHAAADGQLGGIIKVYREWRISGGTTWMKQLWPRVKSSLNYCIEIWDPRHKGVLEEPHHNTYDIEFWGADGMCSSFYLGALRAAVLMGSEAGDDISLYEELYAKGREIIEDELFDGEYFIQKIQWTGLTAPAPTEVKIGIRMNYSSEARELLTQEGPKYQYGSGCLSDGVLGAWLADMCGLATILDPEKIQSHLIAVYKYNLRHNLANHANPQRPTYALGDEGGLLLCSWPKGGALSLPFVYSNEVWTGIEYQVASHLILMGEIEKGLEIVRICRSRYDGRIRNPFNEYECGHWYARAMASYSLLQALSGVCYDAVDRILTIEPRIKGDFRVFLATATGFASVGVKEGKPFVEVKHGEINIDRIDFK